MGCFGSKAGTTAVKTPVPVPVSPSIPVPASPPVPVPASPPVPVPASPPVPVIPDNQPVTQKPVDAPAVSREALARALLDGRAPSAGERSMVGLSGATSVPGWERVAEQLLAIAAEVLGLHPPARHAVVDALNDALFVGDTSTLRPDTDRVWRDTANASVVPFVAAVLQAGGMTPAAELAACRLLSTLSGNLNHEPALRAHVGALLSVCNTPDAASFAARVVWNLARDSTGRTAVVRAGGPQKLLDALEVHRDDPRAAHALLGAVSMLTTTTQMEVDKLAAEGAPSMLTASQEARRLLGHLVVRTTGGNGLAIVVSTLVDHLRFLDVQLQGCTLLWHLATWPDAPANLVRAGAVGALVELVHLLDKETGDALSAATLAAATLALRNITTSPAGLEVLATTGVPIVLEALRRLVATGAFANPDRARAAWHLCACMVSLLQHDVDLATLAATDSGAARVLVTAARAAIATGQSGDPATRATCLHVLHAASGGLWAVARASPRACRAVADDEGLQTCLEALSHPWALLQEPRPHPYAPALVPARGLTGTIAALVLANPAIVAAGSPTEHAIVLRIAAVTATGNLKRDATVVRNVCAIWKATLPLSADVDSPHRVPVMDVLTCLAACRPLSAAVVAAVTSVVNAGRTNKAFLADVQLGWNCAPDSRDALDAYLTAMGSAGKHGTRLVTVASESEEVRADDDAAGKAAAASARSALAVLSP